MSCRHGARVDGGKGQKELSVREFLGPAFAFVCGVNHPLEKIVGFFVGFIS